MRKIKSVITKKDLPNNPSGTEGSFLLNNRINDIYTFGRFEFSQIEMGKLKDWFDITYETECFELEVPSVEELRKGYYISIDGIVGGCAYINDFCLRNAYAQGNWSATKEPLEKLKKYRDTIQYCNALWKVCEAENEVVYKNSHIILEWNKDNEMFVNSHSVYIERLGFKFSSYKSAEQFLKQCDPLHLETLKEMYNERGLV